MLNFIANNLSDWLSFDRQLEAKFSHVIQSGFVFDCDTFSQEKWEYFF